MSKAVVLYRVIVMPQGSHIPIAARSTPEELKQVIVDDQQMLKEVMQCRVVMPAQGKAGVDMGPLNEFLAKVLGIKGMTYSSSGHELDPSNLIVPKSGISLLS